MIYIPEEFFTTYLANKNENEIRKLRKKLEKQIRKLEKSISKNKVCLDYLPFESQLITARQQYEYVNHVFCGDRVEIIKYDPDAIKEVIEIIKDKKAYEIIDKKKLRYHDKVANVKDIIGTDNRYMENYLLIKEKSIDTYTKEEVITRLTYIYNQDYEGYDSFVANIEDGTLIDLLERYLEA